jgi:hypothetical protein
MDWFAKSGGPLITRFCAGHQMVKIAVKNLIRNFKYRTKVPTLINRFKETNQDQD